MTGRARRPSAKPPENRTGQNHGGRDKKRLQRQQQTSERLSAQQADRAEWQAFQQQSEVLRLVMQGRASADVNLEFAHRWADLYRVTPPEQIAAKAAALKLEQEARLSDVLRRMTGELNAERAAAGAALKAKHKVRRVGVKQQHANVRRVMAEVTGRNDFGWIADELARRVGTRRQLRLLVPVAFRVAALQTTGAKPWRARGPKGGNSPPKPQR